MNSVFDEEEFKSSVLWRLRAQKGAIETIGCVAAWMDICGFGTLLEKSRWNLEELPENGAFAFLSKVYSTAARPLCYGVPPMPFEMVLVINDGIARTLNFKYNGPKHDHGLSYAFYIRNLLICHRNLFHDAKEYNCGIRTVLAGGETSQYSPEKFTGSYILRPSDHADAATKHYEDAMHAKTFVYNPAEFQMNTAFAKAYSIESLGSKSGICVNSCYMELSFWEKLNNIPSLNAYMKEGVMVLDYDGETVIELKVDRKQTIHFKGLDMSVYKLLSMKILPRLDGDEVLFDLVTCEYY